MRFYGRQVRCLPGRRVLVTGLVLALVVLLGCALAEPGAAGAATTRPHTATAALSFFPTAVTAPASRTVPGRDARLARPAAVFAPEAAGAAPRFIVDANGVATDLGVRVSADRPVVIGEAMQARVIPAAQKLGADWYQPPTFANDAQSLAHNRYWVNEMMNQGRGVIDIGAAPGRANWPNPTSPWFAMEQDQVIARAYEFYLPYTWDW